MWTKTDESFTLGTSTSKARIIDASVIRITLFLDIYFKLLISYDLGLLA